MTSCQMFGSSTAHAKVETPALPKLCRAKGKYTQRGRVPGLRPRIPSSQCLQSSGLPCNRMARVRGNDTFLARPLHIVMSGDGATTCSTEFIEVANKVADAAAKITSKYFRSKLGVERKSDESPVTIADREAEEAMRKIIKDAFPNHGIFGEEEGMDLEGADSGYLWVLDPIDGTKSFITGKPLFGTLIALLYKGKPILGIIDQPILKERWLGAQGQETTLNGEAIHVRECEDLTEAYLYATSPHMFEGDTESAFGRVREQVLQPMYGCDCYAYGLLAAGHCDIVVEASMQPYDYMALIPIIEGAGGMVTDWQGQHLNWPVTPSNEYAIQDLSGEVLACGDKRAHDQALKLLNWEGGGTYDQAATKRDVTFMS